jgi:predicted Zn finger-like uncharacterized protein
MALATQCPHCKTTFRVAQDQLKLRAGLVRCGSCKEIFNGIEHLLRPDSAAQVTPQANTKPAEHAPATAPVAKPVAEPVKAVAPSHHPETEISEDLASEGIPISLLAKQPAAKAEPEPTGTQLDFAYPDPLPESEPEPAAPTEAGHHHIVEPQAEPEAEQAHHAGAKTEPHLEPYFYPHYDARDEHNDAHQHEPFIEPETPAAQAHSEATVEAHVDAPVEDQAEQELEAHAAEAVEFVDYVEVPRTHKEPTAEILDVEENKPVDPLQRMTLVDLSDADEPVDPYIEDVEDISQKPKVDDTTWPDTEAEADEPKAEPAQLKPEEPDPLDQVIDELKRKPLRGKKKPKPYKRLPTQAAPSETAPEPEIDPDPDPEEHDEPEFVKQGRRAQTVGRTVRIAMGVGSFFLFFGALGQATYTFRDQIAARVPETKPLLVNACVLLNCKVGLPAQIEMLSIESDQLETLSSNKDMSELTMLLRNSSTLVQAWPNLEVTLNDNNNVALSRRIYAPRDYLPASVDDKKGFASNSEQPVKMRFDFTGIKPAGYHVGVFYP